MSLTDSKRSENASMSPVRSSASPHFSPSNLPFLLAQGPFRKPHRVEGQVKRSDLPFPRALRGAHTCSVDLQQICRSITTYQVLGGQLNSKEMKMGLKRGWRGDFSGMDASPLLRMLLGHVTSPKKQR
jgi:hypothetical protein